MNYFLNSILLLSIISSNIAFGLTDIQRIRDDIKRINQTCDFDTCSSRYKNRFPHYTCDCEISCIKFGTCCLESLYVEFPSPKVRSTCRSVYNGGTYFMIDSCPTNDTVWDDLCRDEWKNEDDVMKLAPVTSLSTKLTYKNYFCLRCHETNDNFLYWKLKLDYKDSQYNISGGNITDNDKEELALKFDGQWIVSLRNNSVRIPVKLLFEIPQEITPLIKTCDSGMISNCSNRWKDTETSEICQAYMGIRRRAVRKGLPVVTYKNLYCAMCNFETLNRITCSETESLLRNEDPYRQREDRYRPREEDRDRPIDEDRRGQREDRYKPRDRPSDEDPYRPREDRYRPREEDRDRPIDEDRKGQREDRYKPRDRPSDDDPYRPREDHYRPREEDRDRPIDEDRHRQREDRYRPRDRPSDEDRYRPTEDRYRPSDYDPFRPRKHPYRPRDEDRIRSREEDRYRPRDEDDGTLDRRTHGYDYDDEERHIPKQMFTFAFLLDVNSVNGDRVGKIQKCDRHYIWDPFAKTCRRLACALPGYKLNNGKCRPE